MASTPETACRSCPALSLGEVTPSCAHTVGSGRSCEVQLAGNIGPSGEVE
ncbi:MAG: hypothetical protein R3F14_37995 [Polyangiaceae bacterium]